MAKRIFHIKTCTVTVDTGGLTAIKQNLRPKAHAILDKAAFDIEGSAKILAPVDTGALRSSIYTSGTSKGGGNYSQRRSEAKSRIGTRGKSGNVLSNLEFNAEIKPAGEFERIIAPSVAYAIYPELSGQPYLAPAVAMHRAAFRAAWKSLILP